MKKTVKKLLFVSAVIALLVVCFAFLASAITTTDGYYTYSVDDGKATITSVDDSISGDVVIPDTLGGYRVTAIGRNAFDYCAKLKSITIPDNVTSIGSSAFDGCTGLTSITIPDSVTSIGYNAFYNCIGLTSITIPNSVTSIGSYAFYGCTGLTSITLPFVGESQNGTQNTHFRYIFGSYNNDSIPERLKEVTITSPCEKIGFSAFDGCTGLTSITIPDSVTSIDDNAFCNCTGLTSITIPDSVTSIGNNAFYKCTGLTSITIPDSVTSIGSYAFYNCTGLTSITLPFVGESQNGTQNTHFGYIFGSYNNDFVPERLKEVTITSPCKKIDSNAFYNCTGFTSITIPDSVTSIGNNAFYNCTGLTSITIPDSVTSIGNNAFYGCTDLISITLPFVGESQNGTLSTRFGYIFGSNIPEKLKEVIITSPCKKIDSNAFYNCTGLTSITIPDSVTSIGNDAFYNCKGLTSIIIPDSVTSIGNDAFYNCTGLTSITLPDSVISIGNDAFYNTGYYNNIFNWKNRVLYIGSHLVKALDSITSCNIRQGIKTIADYAFYNCTGLTSIIIPDGVTSIGSSAFKMCSELTSITFHSSLTNINKDAFEYTNLKYVFYDGTESQNNSITIAFNGNEVLFYDAVWHYQATDHIYNNGKVTTAPTCENNGIKLFNCVVDGCDYSTYQEIPATNHINKTEHTQQDATCTENGYTAGIYCPDCETWLEGHEYIGELGHTNNPITTPAALSQSGKIEIKCNVCGEVESSTTIYSPKTIKLSSTSVTYNGKTRSPSVTVKDSNGNTLIKDTDYTVKTPSGRKAPGQYTYTIKFKGNYEGEKKLTFTILPKAPTTISATQSTSVIKLTWSESTGATGYRVYQYSPSKGKYVQIASVKGVTSYRKATNLKAGTEYKFKVKPYTKLSDGTVLWGTASEAFATATECKAPKITSVTSPSKSKATVKWSNVEGETGYQLYYSTKKTSGFKKVDSYSANKLTGSKTLSSFASGKTIYFKVRAYKKVGGQTIYSEWSAVKSVKLK